MSVKHEAVYGFMVKACKVGAGCLLLDWVRGDIIVPSFANFKPGKMVQAFYENFFDCFIPLDTVGFGRL